METLILARTVQGMGGGLVVAVALAAVGVTFPEHLRSRAFAANSTVWGVMSFAGPALAAALVRTPLGWRAVFAVNIPLTLFAAFIGWNRLPGNARERRCPSTFDLKGEDTEVSNLARTAIAAGYRASHIVSLVLSLGAVVFIVRLHRWAKPTL